MAMRPSLERLELAMGSLARAVLSPKGDTIRCNRAGVSLPPVAQRILGEARKRGPCRVSELARATRTDEGAVSRQVTLLEQRSIVERRPDPSDRRASLVHVTDEGDEAARALREAADAIFSELLADWTDEDADALAQLMERLVEDITPGERGVDGVS